jgi:hypothetical protein
MLPRVNLEETTAMRRLYPRGETAKALRTGECHWEGEKLGQRCIQFQSSVSASQILSIYRCSKDCVVGLRTDDENCG